ncbi:MAG: SDR family NAD(P)-dependent oxidoreductase [Clostridia bacterium]|nr:SDR family NAD(P)-dependent oxidoreductase [Clostridia bacterium]
MAMVSNRRFCLRGKNVIVTGASGGLGSALARRLIVYYGCRVLGVARRQTALDALTDELGEAFRGVAADVSRREDWEALAAFAEEQDFDADVLINNAGVLPRFAAFGAYSSEEIRSAIRVNAASVLYGTETFLPRFLAKEGTAIVNIASADALCPLAGTSVYSAGKAGVMAFSEVLREEYCGRVYIPAVCPGFIRTGIMRHQTRTVSPLVERFSLSPESAAKRLLRRVNAGRSRIVIGIDAHLMSGSYRVAPVLAPRLFRRVLKATGLEMFADI